VTAEYKTELRMYSSSIKNKQNRELRLSLLAEEISAASLVQMTSTELAPGELKERMDEVRKKNLFLAQGAENIKAVTDQFRCGKCKKRKCSYFQMQTRSADGTKRILKPYLSCMRKTKLFILF
jgi:transcription elongation factor S-II